MSTAIHWSSTTKEALINDYHAGDSSVVLAQRYDVASATVRRWLQVWGVTLRTQSESNKRYQWDERFFLDIRTQEQAYWLGFLAADGCVGDDGRITIGLQIRDLAQLEKFRATLGGEQSIWASDDGCSVTFCSRLMANDLAGHGIVPRKSLTARAAHLSEDLARHYWRGVIDGDGCLSPLYRKLTLVGSEGLLTGFRQFCLTLGPEDLGQVRSRESIFQFAIHGKKARRVIGVLYGDATVYLDRKRIQALSMCSIAPGVDGRPEVTPAIGVEWGIHKSVGVTYMQAVLPLGLA
jgi:hypothetical protein